MILADKNPELQNFLDCSEQNYRISSLGLINLGTEEFRELLAKFAKKLKTLSQSHFPDYLAQTLDLRTDPLKLFPWAKSAFTGAIPFAELPKPEKFLPTTDDSEIGGKIAAYGARKDYHIFGKELFTELANDLKELDGIPQDFKFAVSVDTMPVAERALAKASGLGCIGRNCSLLVNNQGSGCFLVELFTDLDLPEIKRQAFSANCNSCNKCVAACTTTALADNSEFAYRHCRSSLTMEKRGPLTAKERNLLNDWIFACDDCSACCPNTTLPPVFHADLEYLLLQPANEIKKLIAQTPLNYAGITLLRRNALAVLSNRNTPRTRALIKKFSLQTGSELLKNSARELLKIK